MSTMDYIVTDITNPEEEVKAQKSATKADMSLKLEDSILSSLSFSGGLLFRFCGFDFSLASIGANFMKQVFVDALAQTINHKEDIAKKTIDADVDKTYSDQDIANLRHKLSSAIETVVRNATEVDEEELLEPEVEVVEDDGWYSMLPGIVKRTGQSLTNFSSRAWKTAKISMKVHEALQTFPPEAIDSVKNITSGKSDKLVNKLIHKVVKAFPQEVIDSVKNISSGNSDPLVSKLIDHSLNHIKSEIGKKLSDARDTMLYSVQLPKPVIFSCLTISANLKKYFLTVNAHNLLGCLNCNKKNKTNDLFYSNIHFDISFNKYFIRHGDRRFPIRLSFFIGLGLAVDVTVLDIRNNNVVIAHNNTKTAGPFVNLGQELRVKLFDIIVVYIKLGLQIQPPQNLAIVLIYKDTKLPDTIQHSFENSAKQKTVASIFENGKKNAMEISIIKKIITTYVSVTISMKFR